MSLFCLAVFGGIPNLTAQTKTSADNQSVISYESLKSKKKLTELFPEISDSNIVSFTYVYACDGKQLEEKKCTGDALPSHFFAYADRSYPTRCTIFFDKIVAASTDGKQTPLIGRIIELKK